MLSLHLHLTFLSHSPLNTCYVHSEQFCLGSLHKTQSEIVENVFPCLGDSTLPWQPPSTPCSEVRDAAVCDRNWAGFHTHFRVLELSGSTVEVSSLQGVGMEGFHCIQRCPHFRVYE